MRGLAYGRRHRRAVSATFIGAVFTLLVILCFYSYRQIERERERMLADLQLKGTTLIHSLEAGARVGMVGMMGGVSSCKACWRRPHAIRRSSASRSSARMGRSW